MPISAFVQKTARPNCGFRKGQTDKVEGGIILLRDFEFFDERAPDDPVLSVRSDRVSREALRPLPRLKTREPTPSAFDPLEGKQEGNRLIESILKHFTVL